MTDQQRPFVDMFADGMEIVVIWYLTPSLVFIII